LVAAADKYIFAPYSLFFFNASLAFLMFYFSYFSALDDSRANFLADIFISIIIYSIVGGGDPFGLFPIKVLL
jgi:hypothetical protein